MSDKNQPKKSEAILRVLTITQEEGAYCLTEYTVPKLVVEKYGQKVSRTEPDIFPILLSHLAKRARAILDI